jgi:processive 1,2-diacylglycerol beta-glucosyltransferase
MKILVLTSSTGGGHDMRARSLKAWAQHPSAAQLGLNVEVFQTLENLNATYRFGVETYNWIQRTAPWLHHGYFNLLEKLSLHRTATRIDKKAARRFSEQIQASGPDLLLSTHAHLNHGFFELARAAAAPQRLPCVTYCGELYGGYGFSRHWVNSQADAFYGAVEPCVSAALNLGMPPERAHLGGFMLHPSFWDPAPEQPWQHPELAPLCALDPEGFTILLSTGANSAQNHSALLKALEPLAQSATRTLNVVALCGSNDQAANDLSQWAAQRPHLPVVTLPRISASAMRALMLGAEVIIARPGTGTTSEAIRCQCPVIHNCLGGVMPQEWITAKYMQTVQANRCLYRTRDLPGLLEPLLKPEEHQLAREAMARLDPKAHPLDLLKALKALAQGSSRDHSVQPAL